MGLGENTMNRAQQRFKDWMIAHIGSPEKMTATDHKVLDLLIIQVPAFFGMVLMFVVLSAVYLWGLKKYGFERTIIVLLINLIITIGQVSGAIKSLSE
jgi:cell division septal protein FtsQ